MEEDGQVAEKLQEEGVKETTPQDLAVSIEPKRRDAEIMTHEGGYGGFVSHIKEQTE